MLKPWPGTDIQCIYSFTIPGGNPGKSFDVPTFKCLEAIFVNILTTVVGIAALALFVMFVIGGFRYLTSAGDPKAAGAAKSTITYAIVGVFLMAIAYLVFSLIEFFTGVPVKIFRIPTTYCINCPKDRVTHLRKDSNLVPHGVR